MLRRILVAPYAYKGTLSAAEGADAIAEGIRRTLPGAEVERLPLGDGGSGTLDALLAGLGGSPRTTRCLDATGRPRDSRWGMTVAGDAILEAAQVIPLADVPLALRNPALLSTHGLGDLLRAAMEERPGHIIIGLGDSATHDCGLGVGAALGYRFLDHKGEELPPVGASLPKLARVDPTHAISIENLPVISYCDVLNPLLGPNGAALRFAGQKGADAVMIALLEEGSARFADIVRRDLGRDVAGIPGAGAAGGLGAGLAAFCGAELRGGATGVLDAVRFDERAAWADLVITGEGRLDGKTTLGKGVLHVVRRAVAQGAEVLLVPGSIEGTPEEWAEVLGARVVAVVDDGGEREGGDAAENLTVTVAKAIGGGLRA